MNLSNFFKGKSLKAGLQITINKVVLGWQYIFYFVLLEGISEVEEIVVPQVGFDLQTGNTKVCNRY